MPKPKRFSFSQWVEFWEVDDIGQRIGRNQDLTDWYNNHNDINIAINKSITSNADTCTIDIWNHRIIEQMYRDKKVFFDRFFEKDYEIDVMQWYECGHADIDDKFVQCIYSGDFDDIYVKDDSSITDQALSINSTAGRRASIRTVLNKKYPAGTAYLAIVQDIFTLFQPGYELTQLDDPNNKLSKTLPRARTYHRKAVDVLNDIARDLEMTWGFAENPWTLAQRRIGGSDPTTGNDPKHCYFVDKISVFDISGIHGAVYQECDGSTGKLGRIGYTKSQFTFEHLYDPPLNIGMPVEVSDFGTMNHPADIATAFRGRVNRMSINNHTVHLECAYINPDTGYAVVENDKKHAGALVL
jgi:hypothetical protein